MLTFDSQNCERVNPNILFRTLENYNIVYSRALGYRSSPGSIYAKIVSTPIGLHDMTVLQHDTF